MKTEILTLFLAAAFGIQTLPASAIVEATGETFLGYAAGLDVRLVSDDTGATCLGQLWFATPSAGRGSLECDDGRSGSFSFSTSPIGATGAGLLGGKALTLSFG